MVTAMYMKQHNGQSPRTFTGGGQGSSKRARVVAWGEYFSTDITKSHLITPCKTQGSSGWGCARFMEYQGISEVKIAKYASRNPAKFMLPPVSQVEPAEVRAEGVPIKDLYDATEFTDMPDPE